MTEHEESANLPALVRQSGGALVAVLQWPQYLVRIGRIEQLQIAILVRSFPDLNTESGVDMLADAMLFYGVKFDAWFAELVETHGIENITLMLEILRDHSVIGGIDGEYDESDDPKTPQVVQTDRDRLELEQGLEFLAWLRELGQEVDTFEQCERLLDRLGGWAVVRLLDYGLLEAFFSGEIDQLELRQRSGAPGENKRGDDEDKEM